MTVIRRLYDNQQLIHIDVYSGFHDCLSILICAFCVGLVVSVVQRRGDFDEENTDNARLTLPYWCGTFHHSYSV